MRRRLALAAAALAAWGPFAPAQVPDYLETEGLLSNEDFYRLVSCRALPGGPCTAEPVHWPSHKARDLSVGIDKLLGEAERLVTRGFAGGGEVLVQRVAADSGDDRGLVLVWRAS